MSDGLKSNACITTTGLKLHLPEKLHLPPLYRHQFFFLFVASQENPLECTFLLHPHPTRIENCSCVKITRQWFCPRQKHFVHLVMHYRYLFCCNRFHCYRFLHCSPLPCDSFYYRNTIDIRCAESNYSPSGKQVPHMNSILWWTSEWTLSNRTSFICPSSGWTPTNWLSRSSVAVCEIYEPNRIWTMYNRISDSVVNNHLLEVDVLERVHPPVHASTSIYQMCVWETNSNAGNSKIIISHRIRVRSGSA